MESTQKPHGTTLEHPNKEGKDKPIQQGATERGPGVGGLTGGGLSDEKTSLGRKTAAGELTDVGKDTKAGELTDTGKDTKAGETPALQKSF